LVQKTIGHKGNIIWDKTKPDGTPRKLMEVSKIKKLGWEPSINLEVGLKKVYDTIANIEWDKK